jgi:hypothetical protein
MAAHSQWTAAGTAGRQQQSQQTAASPELDKYLTTAGKFLDKLTADCKMTARKSSGTPKDRPRKGKKCAKGTQ